MPDFISHVIALKVSRSRPPELPRRCGAITADEAAGSVGAADDNRTSPAFCAGIKLANNGGSENFVTEISSGALRTWTQFPSASGSHAAVRETRSLIIETSHTDA
jgi:hypothetical protein